MSCALKVTSQHADTNLISFHGIATHYLDSSSLPDLEKRLAELTFKDYATLNTRYRIINATIEEFVTSLPYDQPLKLVGDVRKTIDECFAFDDIAKIMKALDSVVYKKAGYLSDWAQHTIKTLHERSPISLKVTLKAMELGSRWDIAETFKREYSMASAFMHHPDFVEGVSAKLIRKSSKGEEPVAPKWQASSLDEVSWNDVDNFFVTSRNEQPLKLLNQGPLATYRTYPHAWLGLPTEADVKAVVDRGVISTSDVVRDFMINREGKLGVKEKVSEILKRKTWIDENKQLVWDTTGQPS